MIRRHLMALRIGLMVADGAIAAAVFLVVADLRYQDGTTSALWRALDLAPTLAALLFAVIWVGVLWTSGLYRMAARWQMLTQVRDIARATLVVIALAAAAGPLLALVVRSDLAVGLFLAGIMAAYCGYVITFGACTGLQSALFESGLS